MNIYRYRLIEDPTDEWRSCLIREINIFARDRIHAHQIARGVAQRWVDTIGPTPEGIIVEEL